MTQRLTTIFLACCLTFGSFFLLPFFAFANPIVELALQGNLDEIKRALSDPHLYIESTRVDNPLSVFRNKEENEEEREKRRPDINKADSEGWTPLLKATLGGHTHVVQYLLEQGADIHAKENKEQQNALMIASAFSHEAIIGILIQAGANIEDTDINGWTALALACSNGHALTVFQLLQHGANLNAIGNDTWSPLMIASSIGSYETVELLLQMEATIDYKNREGWTALMVAAGANNIAVVDLLLQYGADIYITNKRGHTALTIAERGKYTNMIKLLSDHASKTPIL